jgi:hypothetical protein
MRRVSGRYTYYEWAQWLSGQVQRRESARPAVPAHVEYRDWAA